jgi:hypothetical protein
MDDAIGTQPEMTLSPTVHEDRVALAAAPPSRPARSRTLLIIVALILVALLVGAGLWWLNYTRSPAYSLGQLAQAVQDRDWVGVQKYVDVQAVVGQAVDAAVSKSLSGDTSGIGSLVTGLTQSAKPALVQQATELLRTSVETRAASSGDGVGSLVGFFAANQVTSVTYLSDGEAIVTVAVPYSGRVFDLRLRMKRTGDHWRVTGIENILDLPALRAP